MADVERINNNETTDNISVKGLQDSLPEGEQTDNAQQDASETYFDSEVKHPLQTEWTLWYDRAQSKTNTKNWGNNLNVVYSFDTIEDFWSVFNHIAPPSRLHGGSNYHLFREGIEPKWEDPTNKKGGKWVLTFPKKGKNTTNIDTLWLHAVLACIGEGFEPGDEICGVVVSVRADKDRLALWTKSGRDEATQVAIGLDPSRPA
eukprot:GEZU01014053.1.p1 GENE.GEZU01014053.1~~GEZU01014053.1.p1  ORF type:complete len:203 (-),score=25.40 GEZU01014053.1:1153-1761(-)